MADEGHSSKWAGITARITARAPVDIDPICGAFDPRRIASGRDIYPGAAVLPEPAMKSDETVAIGVRIRTPPERPADMAMRLASLGHEKGIEVIVLNYLDYTGLERFGFRVERICGETEKERALCEQEIRRFWSIQLVI